MPNHDILGGKVSSVSAAMARSGSVRPRSQASNGVEPSLAPAEEVAEDWYLGLRSKSRAGLLLSEETFAQVAERFLKEYEPITEGERSKRWTEGHETRLRVHLVPFFGEFGISQVTPGKVQHYRIHRMTSRLEPNPASKTNRPLKDKPPARSTFTMRSSRCGKF